MFAAIILAAGASRRMGAPKALLTYRGRTFLEGILDACTAVGIDRHVVVVGYDADNILKNSQLEAATVVRSADLEAGPIGSIRAGIQAIMAEPIEAALIWPVDRPHVPVGVIAALLDRYRARHPAIAVPVFEERRGHPVLFDRSVFAELLSAPDAEGARAVVRRDPARVAGVAVSDRAVLEDINTPDDYRALKAREESG